MQPTLKSMTIAVLWTMMARSSMALPLPHLLSKRAGSTDLLRHYMHGKPTFKTYEASEESTVNDMNPHKMSFDVASSDLDVPGFDDASNDPYADFQTVAYDDSQPANDGITANQIDQYSTQENSNGWSTNSQRDAIAVDDVRYTRRPDDRTLMNLVPEDLLPYKPSPGRTVFA